MGSQRFVTGTLFSSGHSPASKAVLLFLRKDPGLSGRGAAGMLRHDPAGICMTCIFTHRFTRYGSLAEDYPTKHLLLWWDTFSFAQFLTKFLKKDDVYNCTSCDITYLPIRRDFLLIRCKWEPKYRFIVFTFDVWKNVLLIVLDQFRPSPVFHFPIFHVLRAAGPLSAQMSSHFVFMPHCWMTAEIVLKIISMERLALV